MLVVHFESELPDAAPCVEYAPVDLNGQVVVVVDVPPEVYPTRSLGCTSGQLSLH